MTDQVHDSGARPVDFLANLGGAMIAAGYPIGLVRRVLSLAFNRYGLTGQILLLPTHVQLGGSDHVAGTTVCAVHVDRDLRFDQTFELAHLVEHVERSGIGPKEGLAEVDRIHALRPRFPAWVNVIGYTTQSAALALILQPTPLALLAASVFGLLVGALGLVSQLSVAAGELLPTVSAFLVAVAVFTVGQHWHLGEDSLRALTPPLALFLPGAAITLATVELSTREIVSGSSRLIAGLLLLGQLALGIVAAAQIVGVSASEFVGRSVTRLGWWAPWAGVALYALGLILYFGPPARFLPWLLAMLFIAYSGQVVANALFGGYSGGFGGGLALMLCGLAISRRPNTPPWAALVLPGFWLLVPGSIALIGVTQLIEVNSMAAVTVLLVSMMAIALGMQAGLLLWRSYRQLRRAVRTKYRRTRH
jgi:uncharacterized membrane protein YjjP (DUF1212 family)